MCELNTCIHVDAHRFKIPNWQLKELHEEFHRIYGNNLPHTLKDLLEVVM